MTTNDPTEFRKEFLTNIYMLIQDAVGDPDLKAERAAKIIETGTTLVEAWKSLALLTNTSSSSASYFFTRDLPEYERNLLTRAEHGLRILTALFGPQVTVTRDV